MYSRNPPFKAIIPENMSMNRIEDELNSYYYTVRKMKSACGIENGDTGMHRLNG